MIDLDHQQWVNVVAMLTGHEPSEVEAAYQKVKATKPPAPLPEVASPSYPPAVWAAKVRARVDARIAEGYAMLAIPVEEVSGLLAERDALVNEAARLRADYQAARAEMALLKRRVDALRYAAAKAPVRTVDGWGDRHPNETLRLDDAMASTSPGADEPHVVWRGSASDFATDVRATLPPDKLADLVRFLSETTESRR